MIRRLFIDPGSISTGYALFEDGRLKLSGTIAAPARKAAFGRLAELSFKYRDLLNQLIADSIVPDEVHIERLPIYPRNEQSPLHSVGAIGAVFADYATVAADVEASWKKAVGWDHRVIKTLEDRDKLPSGFFKTICALTTSHDEMAAIGQGLYWVNRSTASVVKRKTAKKRRAA